jgi:3-dehydroquinate dehydratase-1
MPLPTGPNIIGVIHNQNALQATETAENQQSCDLFEVRWDAFMGDSELVIEWVARQRLPLIMTARSPREGGPEGLAVEERARLLTLALPHAYAVDVELSSLSSNPEVADSLIAEVRKADASLILSFHDFEGTPSLDDLEILATSARAAGADIFKAATVTESATDLAVLLQLAEICEEELNMAFSLMGMGAFGQVSRLALAQAGSVLNYCSVEEDDVAAPGQWSAVAFADVLRKLGLR